MKVKSQSCSVVSDSLQHHGLNGPWNSPDQNTGVRSLSLLQGIFSTEGPNPGLLHCRRILYLLSHRKNPRILEWVAYPFSSGSSWPKNQTAVFCIAGRSFTNRAIREANQSYIYVYILSQTPLPSRLPHNVEQSSMCYAVGPPLQYSCLENAMDRGARRATEHGVVKSRVGHDWVSLKHSQASGWTQGHHRGLESPELHIW